MAISLLFVIREASILPFIVSEIAPTRVPVPQTIYSSNVICVTRKYFITILSIKKHTNCKLVYN